MYKKSINVFYSLFVIITFLSFIHSDLIHTSISSNTLYITNFGNFYDLNKSILGESSYLPLIYFIFAIWHLPLKIFGVNLIDVLNPNVTEILTFGSKEKIIFLYDKFLIIIFFIFSSQSFKNITQELKIKNFNVLFTLSAPLVFFSIVLFGGYDIILLFFTLLAFEYYLKGRIYRFFIASALAISLKFYAFPFLAFLSIKFLKNNSIKFLFGFFIALFLFTLQIIPFLENNSFLYSITNLFFSKSKNNFTFLNPSIFVIFLYTLTFVILLISKDFYNFIFNKKENFLLFIFIINFLLFISTPWSPQWLIYLCPFIYLLAINFNHVATQLKIDILISIILIVLIISIWPYNIDTNMLNNGILRNLSENKIFSLSNLFFIPFYKNNNLNYIFISLYLFFYFLLFAPVFFKFFKFKFLNTHIGFLKFLRITPFVVFFTPFFLNANNIDNKFNNINMFVLSDYKDQTLYLEDSNVCHYFDNKFYGLSMLGLTVPNPDFFINKISNTTLSNADLTDELTYLKIINKTVFFKVNNIFYKNDRLKFCFELNEEAVYTGYNRKKYYKSILSINDKNLNIDLPVKLFYEKN